VRVLSLGPHDDARRVFPGEAQFWSSDYLWNPQLRRTTGLIEPAVYGRDVAVAAAAFGGGSVLYAGATQPPIERYFGKVAPKLPSYAELAGEYFPRAVAKLGATHAPPDVLASGPFRHARVYAEQLAKAGIRAFPLLSTFDWDLVRRELAGTARKSATIGEMVLGNSNGSKRELTLTYLAAARRSPTVRAATLANVARIAAHPRGYEVDVEFLAPDGAVRERRAYTARRVFLGAGTAGTARLLLRARETGDLPNLNEHVGTQVGDNGDSLAVRSYGTDAQPQASPLVVGRSSTTTRTAPRRSP
jgi:cholesterol oxidase